MIMKGDAVHAEIKRLLESPAGIAAETGSRKEETELDMIDTIDNSSLKHISYSFLIIRDVSIILYYQR
jgi:hypothetical protein